ncbi:helix-hairpin-helix domain-containing protein [Limosilactobacillus sp.]|jgi:competence protein ComEA|uniref:helix-hairpin-helix domain-containing protein n=1 Tax=Limosilactobacillus sp. TaxID=2773925 RepID=UPI0025BBE6F6|nr:helix-hairpin-helix domain-containing protein [Limosilactobacillus sp.]MCH3922547.1 helix-hairpin-helix domain-containing protein [Limosilactobacillus sp.]MCH3927229.1 helix-hairpin-helix domain-containing protein [Limosilactobacillus sp.]
MERLRELWTSYRSQILILVALVILVAGWYFKSPQQSQAVETFSSSQQSLASQATSNVSATAGPVCVDVKGAVKHPGVYKLRAGARVDEAIEAAGGVLATADMKQVNRAKQLTDQQVVYIPLPGESIPGTAGGEATATEASGSSDQPIVNLNTATKEQLCQITGIGDKKADLIIQYRQEHGQFKSVDDLKQVSGFGDKSVDKIRSQLAV